MENHIKEYLQLKEIYAPQPDIYCGYADAVDIVLTYVWANLPSMRNPLIAVYGGTDKSTRGFMN